MKNRAFLFMLLSFILLTSNLGSWGITETSEARYAEISKEMLENQDYIHPKLLNIHHYHKPPLTYYITTFGYKIFGINEFGARFFLQIAIIIQLLLIYKITNLLYTDKTIAFSAMLIYFSMPIVLISSRNLTTDAYLNTSVLASIYFWLTYKFKNRIIYMYLFYIVMAISFNIKGPVGWIFPFIFIIVFKLVFKDKPKVSVHHIFSIILFLIISFSWYVIVFIENKLLWNYFIKEQIMNRIASKSYNRSKPFWFYFLLLPGIGLPWIFFLIHQIIKKFKAIKTEKSFDYVITFTIFIILIIFSIFKTKLILYILPMFGFVAILIARFLYSSNAKTLKAYNIVIISFTTLILIGLLGMSFIKSDLKFNSIFSIIISISFGFIMVYLSKVTIKKPQLKTTFFGYVFGCLILISGTLLLKKNQTKLNSTKEVLTYINKELKNKKNIVVYNYLLPSAAFYSDKNLITLNNGHNTVQRETQFETNNYWKPYNLDIRTNTGATEALKVLNNQSVLITRKKHQLPENLKFLQKNLDHVKDFGKWIIYY